MARGLAGELIPILTSMQSQIIQHAANSAESVPASDEEVRLLFANLDSKLSIVVRHYSSDAKSQSKALRKFLKTKRNRVETPTISTQDMLDCRVNIAHIVAHLENFVQVDSWSR